MTTTTTTNGHARKTLASQIDRLDSMLDGLSEGLNQAVADAVQGAVELAVRQAVGQAVKEAVQAVLTEVLSNADLLAAVRGLLPVPPSPDAPRTDPPERPRGLLRRACEGVKAGLGAAATACGYVVGRAAGVKAVARGGWQLARKFRGRVLAACGVGLAAGAVTLLAAPWVGVAAAAVGGFFATLAVKARSALCSLVHPAPALA
jgi:hypothetical protein